MFPVRRESFSRADRERFDPFHYMNQLALQVWVRPTADQSFLFLMTWRAAAHSSSWSRTSSHEWLYFVPRSNESPAVLHSVTGRPLFVLLPHSYFEWWSCLWPGWAWEEVETCFPKEPCEAKCCQKQVLSCWQCRSAFSNAAVISASIVFESFPEFRMKSWIKLMWIIGESFFVQLYRVK